MLQDELSELRKELEEKSFHLRKVEFFLEEFQESSRSKEENLKLLNEENAVLKQQLESNVSMQRKFEKDLKSKEEKSKRRGKKKNQKEEPQELAGKIISFHNK